MNLPSFDKDGNISMSEVMSAKPEDFIALGVPVVDRLCDLMRYVSQIKDDLNYANGISAYIHNKLHEFDPDGGKRTPGYQLNAEFCFWYNVYTNITHSFCGNFSPEMLMSVLDCEIEIVEHGTLVGRNNEGLNKFQHQPIVIHKGVRIFDTKKGEHIINKRRRTVIVNHFLGGYYGSHKIHHPKLVWAGAGGYWMEVEAKDVIV